jgi:NAD(P)-dependent dehydrogenase (short-subunit alcohol dehydrogenase family)
VQVSEMVFLVTGAASGLGAGVACALAERGASVVLADVNAVAGADLCKRLGRKTGFIKTDVTSEKEGAAAVDLAKSAFGGLHGLVNCAGVAPSERVLGRKGPHSLETFARAVSINLVGTFNMVRLAAVVMSEMPLNGGGERGVIVNTASIAAFEGQIGQSAYAASKAGVAGLTLPLARDLARHAIRVVTIAPGIFETPMLASLPSEAAAELAASVPFPQRLGQPHEFAALVVHICENSMLNGTVIRLDAALRMAPK